MTSVDTACLNFPIKDLRLVFGFFSHNKELMSDISDLINLSGGDKELEEQEFVRGYRAGYSGCIIFYRGGHVCDLIFSKSENKIIAK